MIKERIKKLCLENGMNISQLEKKLGVSNGTIQRWNKAHPRAETLSKVAECLKTTPNYLLFGQEPTIAKIKGNENLQINNNGDKNFFNQSKSEQLNEIETELIGVCRKLDTRRKTKLLTYAYDLEKE